MATRTFIADGTSRNYSANSSWVELTAPTAADDVVFLTNVAGSTLVIDGTSGSPNLCRSIDTTNYTRTITFATTKQLNIGTGTAGACKFTAGITFVPSATSVLKFVSTTTGNNITFAGYSFGTITFDGVGGGWQYQDALAANGSATTNLTNGALDTNGKAVTNYSLATNNSNTRSLTMGATIWTVPSGGSWNITTATGMTLSAASSTIILTNTTTSTTFAGAGLTYGTVQNTVLTTGAIKLSGVNTFGTLDIEMAGGSVSPVVSLAFINNQTVSTQLTLKGNSLTNRLFIGWDLTGGHAYGSQISLVCNGTITAQHLDIQDIAASGSASWNLSAITGGSGNCGGNTGITFTPAANQFWVSGTGNYSDVTKWMTTTGGSTPGRVPLAQDSAKFDANSFTAGSQTVTMDASAYRRIGGIDFTGATNSPTFAVSGFSPQVYGSLKFISAMTMSGTQTFHLDSRSNVSLTTGGLSITTSIDQLNTIDPRLVGSLTLNDNLTLSGSATFTITQNNADAGVNTGLIIASGVTAITVPGGLSCSNKITIQAAAGGGTTSYGFIG